MSIMDDFIPTPSLIIKSCPLINSEIGISKRAKVVKKNGGGIIESKSKRKFGGKSVPGPAVARGCGKIMSNRRKRTTGAVSQS